MPLHNEILAVRDRFVQLQVQVDRVASTVPNIPSESQIHEPDMIALQQHVAELGCRVLDLRQIGAGIWRPFWTAVYEDWGRSNDPHQFWKMAQHHVAATIEFLDRLLLRENCPRCQSCGSILDR